ncbi:MAG: hypothetical protein ACRD1X_13930 [Vicinamibacteria bacterium]
MLMRFFLAVALATSMLVLDGSEGLVVHAQTSEPHNFLRTVAGFSEAELGALDQGSVVVKAVDTPNDSEVVLIGAALFRTSTEFFLKMYEDIERFESPLGPLKKVSDPPRAEDFDSLVLPDKDIDALAKCHLGDCDLKLGEAGITRFQNEIDWASPQARPQAQSLARELALAYLTAYRTGGNEAFGVRRDNKKPTLVKEQFEALLEDSDYILTYVPDLHRYLLEYPRAALPGATDFLYWAVNDFGLDPVLRLSHVTIYRPGGDENSSAVIASKQLYFSRYFYTGLDLRFLVRDQSHASDESFYLVTVSRFRSDELGGLFGGVLRKAAEEGARDGLQRYLEVSKPAIESYFRNR